VRPLAFRHFLILLGAAILLAACTVVSSPRHTSETPTVRCANEPGRGQSLSETRPLFFIFCAQSP